MNLQPPTDDAVMTTQVLTEINLLDKVEEDVLPWDNKPTGPIWVDFTPLLSQQLPVNKLVLVANLALNRLTIRDHGEIFYDAGVEVNVKFVPKEKTE